MDLDPRTPVLVGVGAVSQREADPARALEPFELMVRALEGAADDAGSRSWLERADTVAVPRGFWDYSDPARLVADRLCTPRTRTQLAEIGVLQTTLIGKAGEAIRDGRADVVLLIAGGEAKWRALQAQKAGGEPTMTIQTGVEPDDVWRPAEDILSPLELQAQLAMPVRQYSVIENALRHSEGQTIPAHRSEVAELWAGMSRVAADNEQAWSREIVSTERVRDAGDGNRMLAFPYTKLHNSQWNVDQAAGLILCSAAAARAAGVSEQQWVLPRAVVESNHMQPLVERRDLHRCPAFGIAADRALAHTGQSVDDVAHLELYSCFPVAVRVQQRELGIDLRRPVTVTGGMAFAGGPLNNFVLQAIVRMARILRKDPGASGLVTAVSGVLTKQGVSLWTTDGRASREASRGDSGSGFLYADVSRETAEQTPRIEPIAGAEGTARVAGYTVLFGASGPDLTVMLCDLEGGGARHRKQRGRGTGTRCHAERAVWTRGRDLGRWGAYPRPLAGGGRTPDRARCVNCRSLLEG